MDDKERADLLEEVHRQGPSKETWEAIFELFALWPENEEKTRYLALAGRKLASWDDQLRFQTSANRYLYSGERLSSVASLVKSIDIYRREDLGSAELLAIAGSGHVRLRRLGILRSEVSSPALHAMVESLYLAELQHLHLGKVLVRTDDVRRLFQSARFTGLRCLKLIDVGLTQKSLEGAQQSIVFGELRSLDLSHNILEDEGVLLLARAPWLRGIEQMELRHNHVTAAAIVTLLSSPFCQQMRRLDVSENRVSGEEPTTLMQLAGEKDITLIV